MNDTRKRSDGIDPWALGVSSSITLETDGKHAIVVKRALSRLKVEAEWIADPGRSAVEAEALRAAASLVGQSIVPRIIWEDSAENSFAMERIDTRLRNWKQDLMLGRVETATAARVGEIVGMLHSRSASCPEMPKRFEDRRHFQDLRIKPCFFRVAERNPDLADAIQACVGRLLETRLALVHGDLSPKNILQDGVDVVLLDWEVTHWGDPRFDLAFCLCHFILKGRRRLLHESTEATNIRRSEMRGLALTFLDGYKTTGLAIADRNAVYQLACLILARIEGDSPVEYRNELDIQQLKAIAQSLLRDETDCANLEDCVQHAFGSKEVDE